MTISNKPPGSSFGVGARVLYVEDDVAGTVESVTWESFRVRWDDGQMGWYVHDTTEIVPKVSE